MMYDLKHIGHVVFACGIVFCFAGILYAIICQLSLHDLQYKSISYVTAITGLGFLLILIGTNLALRFKVIYGYLLVFGSELAFMAILFYYMLYPENWYYPLAGYVIVLYAIGILILAGNLFVNTTTAIKFEESVFDDETIPLLYWKSEESNRMNVIQNDISDLTIQCKTLIESLEDEQQNAKSDVKKLLLRSLGVLDSFDALFKKIEEKEQNVDKQTKIWLGNFRTIRKKIERNMSESGVSRIESPDGKAIPGIDTVVDTEERESIEDGTIIEYIERGYAWRGEILRKSSVIAVKNKGDME